MTIQPIIDRLRELHAASTQGEWFPDGEEVRLDLSPETTESGISDCTVGIADCGTIDNSGVGNSQFIAFSHNRLPEVLAALETSLEYEKISDALAVKYCEQISDGPWRIDRSQIERLIKMIRERDAQLLTLVDVSSKLVEGGHMNSRSEMKRIAVQKPELLIAEIERLRAANRGNEVVNNLLKQDNARLRSTLERIAGAAGNPNAAEGCRIIISLARAALEGK